MATFGWSPDAALPAPSLFVPSTPPQAASSVPALDIVSPAAPSRRRTWRRERRPSTSCSKKRSSSRSGSGMLLLLGDDNRMGWVPGEQDVAAGPHRLGLGAPPVLLDRGELLATGGVHDVLDRGPEEAGQLDPPAQDVHAARWLDVGRQQRELLRADS